MKFARTYYDLTNENWIDGDIELANTYADDCTVVVKKYLILVQIIQLAERFEKNSTLNLR